MNTKNTKNNNNNNNTKSCKLIIREVANGFISTMNNGDSYIFSTEEELMVWIKKNISEWRSKKSTLEY